MDVYHGYVFFFMCLLFPEFSMNVDTLWRGTYLLIGSTQAMDHESYEYDAFFSVHDG